MLIRVSRLSSRPPNYWRVHGEAGKSETYHRRSTWMHNYDDKKCVNYAIMTKVSPLFTTSQCHAKAASVGAARLQPPKKARECLQIIMVLQINYWMINLRSERLNEWLDATRVDISCHGLAWHLWGGLTICCTKNALLVRFIQPQQSTQRKGGIQPTVQWLRSTHPNNLLIYIWSYVCPFLFAASATLPTEGFTPPSQLLAAPLASHPPLR